MTNFNSVIKCDSPDLENKPRIDPMLNLTTDQLQKIPVRISIVSDLLLMKESYVQFETNMDRFLMTKKFVEEQTGEKWEKSYSFHTHLVDHLEKDLPFNEYLFTIGIHYVVSLPIVQNRINNYPIEPISILLKIDHERFDLCHIVFNNYELWLIHGNETLESLINHTKNK